MSVASEERWGVAVVGVAGRFPGAASIEAFWSNLLEGRESITRFALDELDPSVDVDTRRAEDYVPVRGILEDAECFDASFFGVTPREAEIMDPQQRVFLELCASALERAGHDPARFDGSIGVYAGMANNSYYLSSVLPHVDKVRKFGAFQAMLANEKDFLATRVSHKLDLRGPSISMYTGCSTSLVAVTEAFHALLSYRTDMALAGGVCVAMPQNTGYLYQEEGIESRDGHCRPFDDAATGTVFSNGAGVVVLRRLEDAIRDGDHIHAVLVGAAINNDGAAKVGFAAPSVEGQAEVVADALAQGDVDPATVGFVEAHGTATRIGDPIEIEGLRQAFGFPASGRQECALGSVKGNFGHLLAAAGVTGLIKAVLAVERGLVPPTVNFDRPNAHLNLARSPFFVNREVVPFPDRGGPRRAGVSSFGIGGTNAHVVLEQAPARPEAPEDPRPELIVLSARSSAALERQVGQFADHFRRPGGAAFGNTAFTLQVGRRAHPHRLAVAAVDAASAARLLDGQGSPPPTTGRAGGAPPDVLFAFPGMGSQYEGMGRAFYARDAEYRATFDECASALRALGHEIAEGVSAGEGRTAGDGPAYSAPTLGSGGVESDVLSLFVTGYSLSRMWMSWGLRPRAVVGHSLGDLVAACVSEVVPLPDALRYLSRLARLVEAAPDGRMLSIRLGAGELAGYLADFDRTVVASDSSPTLSVASGPEEEIAELSRRLEARGVPQRALRSRKAFHSPLMDGLEDGLWEVASQMNFGRPRVPWASSITGRWVDKHTGSDPAYWVRHPRATVRFREAAETALGSGVKIGLELGGGVALSTCLHQLAEAENFVTVQALPSETATGPEEWLAGMRAVGACWVAGCEFDWVALHPAGRRRVRLPTYPFDRTRHALPARAAAPGSPHASEGG